MLPVSWTASRGVGRLDGRSDSRLLRYSLSGSIFGNSMDFHGFGWIFTDLYGSGWIWMDLYGSGWIWMDLSGSGWIWMDLNENQ